VFLVTLSLVANASAVACLKYLFPKR